MIFHKHKKCRILVVGFENRDCAKWLLDKTTSWNGGEVVYDLAQADLVMFTGGADIDPEIYGENTHDYTYPDYKRDNYELAVYRDAEKAGIPMIGICRGAQLLTIMAGGTLIQHVHGHAEKPHGVKLTRSFKTVAGISSSVLYIPSTHHQMMNPYVLSESDYQIIGYAEDSLSVTYSTYEIHLTKPMVRGYIWGKGNVQHHKEPEIVYYNKIKGLAIQGHPERLFAWHPMNIYLKNLVKELLKTKNKTMNKL